MSTQNGVFGIREKPTTNTKTPHRVSAAKPSNTETVISHTPKGSLERR